MQCFLRLKAILNKFPEAKSLCGHLDLLCVRVSAAHQFSPLLPAAPKSDCILYLPQGKENWWSTKFLPPELTPPRCRTLDISYGAPKTPTLQLPNPAASTPKGWNGGIGARAITSAQSTKAKHIIRALHQLMAQAVLPSLISSQGIFGRQEAGWYFSFKQKSQLLLPAHREPCKTLGDLHQDRNPIWANAGQHDHGYIPAAANIPLVRDWASFTLGTKSLREAELHPRCLWNLPKPRRGSSQASAGASDPAAPWALAAHQMLGPRRAALPVSNLKNPASSSQAGQGNPAWRWDCHWCTPAQTSSISCCSLQVQVASALKEIKCPGAIHATKSYFFPNIKLFQLYNYFQYLTRINCRRSGTHSPSAIF